jgi:hypothetical protein
VAFQNFAFTIVPLIFALLESQWQRSILIAGMLPLVVTLLILKEDGSQGNMLDKGFVTVMGEHCGSSSLNNYDHNDVDYVHSHSSIYNEDTFIQHFQSEGNLPYPTYS